MTLTTIAAQLEDRIRSNRLLQLPVSWQDELIYPSYDGLSIMNLMQSVAGIFGVEVDRPLDEAVWAGQSLDDVERVVLFLTDGLGYKLLTQFMLDDAGVRDGIEALTDGRGPVPLTSTAPSTTAVALPTFWTARTPGEHGMISTMMYLSRFGTVGNMLSYAPAFGQHGAGAFSEWNMPPETFVEHPTLAEQLATVNVPVHLLLENKLHGTGLSRIMHRGVAHGHHHTGNLDMWLRLRDVLEQTAGQRCFVNAYWPVVDLLSHAYGFQSKYVYNEIAYQIQALRDLLSDPGVQDGHTLVLIVADHGHYDSVDTVDLPSDDSAKPIYDAMRGSFGGELRFAHLFLQSGSRQRVIDVLAQAFNDRLAWVEPQTARHAGLFGNGDTHPDVMNRMGDLIVISRQGYRLRDYNRYLKAIGIHGGLSDWEMMVPLIWRRI